jgi:hypothetical protein
MIIKFTNTLGIEAIAEPKPASAYLPEWYKNTESYMGGEKKPTGDGTTTGTIKKCVPVFDAITAGYIITLPADVFVSQKEGAPWYEWANFGLVQFHPVEQAPEHPARNGMPAYPKWINPWAISTPKGYSVLFTQPLHRDSPFKILDGIVDTDIYKAPVNFPFVLTDPKFEGIIPQGTPIAQVIPIKRESWQMELGQQAEFEEQIKITQKLRTRFFDSYRNQFWTRKEYR